MDIPKAIEILQEEINSGVDGTMFDLHNAQKLSIEALERIQELRKIGFSYVSRPLDNETLPPPPP